MIDIWKELARARTSSGDELLLRHRAGVYEIRCNGFDLMSNRAHRSEEALAQLALEQVAAPAPRILVGGLGMGFTLRAALDAAPAAARIVVAELLPEIVAWNEGALAPLAGRPLADTRVELRIGDVAALLATAEAPYHAILLDIDNGPEAVVYERNESLYSTHGLTTLRMALARDGVLAIWSADRSTRFERALEEAGFSWRAAEVAARGVSGDPAHVIYLAHAMRQPQE